MFLSLSPVRTYPGGADSWSRSKALCSKDMVYTLGLVVRFSDETLTGSFHSLDDSKIPPTTGSN